MNKSPWYQFIGQSTNPATGKPYKTTYQVEKAAGIRAGYLSNYFTGRLHPDNMWSGTRDKVVQALGRTPQEVRDAIIAEREHRRQSTGQAAQA